MELDKNYKVRVTPEQSRKIHSLILLDGGEVSYGLKPQLQDEFLVIENEHGSVVIYYTDQDTFLSAEQQEIQADDLITLLTLLTDLPKSAENPLQDMELTPGLEAVERPMTLVEKLEQEVNRLLELKAQEKPHSLGYVFLGHHIAATVNAINIVKQHEAESEVQDD